MQWIINVKAVCSVSKSSKIIINVLKLDNVRIYKDNLPNTGILVLFGSPYVTSTPSGILSIGMGGGTFSLPKRLDCLLSRPDKALILLRTGYLDSAASGLPVLGCDVGRSPERDTPRISMFSGLLIRERGCCICGKLTPALPVLSWDGGLTPTCDILIVYPHSLSLIIQCSRNRKKYSGVSYVL